MFNYVKLMSDMVDNQELLHNLYKLGLDAQEASLYLISVNSPALAILDLSKIARIPRTTVYRICESLVAKKFGEWILDENGKRFSAVKPQKLSYLVEDKATELEVTRDALQNLQTAINTEITHAPKTQVRFYQGNEGIKQIIWNSLAAEEEIIGYSTYGRREVVGDIFYNKYVSEFRARKLRDRVITNENAVVYLSKYLDPITHQQEVADIKVIPAASFYVSGDTTVYNNIYAVSFWRHGELVGVEIENPEIVKMQRSIFNLLWETAQPIAGLLAKK